MPAWRGGRVRVTTVEVQVASVGSDTPASLWSAGRARSGRRPPATWSGQRVLVIEANNSGKGN